MACQPASPAASAACASAERSTCPPWPEARTPPGPVEHGAEVVAVAALDLSDVDRHPHEQLAGLEQVDRGQLALDLLGGRDGCADVGEDRVDPVADAFDDASSRALEGRPHDPVVPLDGGPHLLGLQLPEHGRVLDVGEQERQRLDLRLNLELERRIVVQDLLLELAETGGGVEPELLEQVGTSLLVGAERLRLPP